MAKQVSKTYGSALFDVAKEKGTLDTTLEEICFVKQTFLENEELQKFLQHPNIAKEDKVKVIENIYRGKVQDEITGLMTVMVQKDRQKDFLAVFDYVIAAIKEEQGIGVAQIVSAVTLSDAQKERIEKRLLETTQYRKIEGIYRVDPALIGGLVIRIQDTVVDSSLRSQIADLSKTLMG